MKDNSAVRARRGLHHRVTKTRAKSAGRTKMTRSLSNTMDVRRCNFRCAHRALGGRTIICRGMWFELRFAILGDACRQISSSRDAAWQIRREVSLSIALRL
jgi:hypothetical protein